jgi:hypothetical protein
MHGLETVRMVRNVTKNRTVPNRGYFLKIEPNRKPQFLPGNRTEPKFKNAFRTALKRKFV